MLCYPTRGCSSSEATMVDEGIIEQRTSVVELDLDPVHYPE